MPESFKTAGFVLVSIAVAGLAAATFLPLVHTQWWLIRLLDFPRVLFGAGALLAVLTALPFLRRFRRSVPVLMGVALLALAANAAVLWPYRPATGPVAASCPVSRAVTVMVANVQLGNHQSDMLLQAVGTVKPDLFLAMETDEWWDQTLRPVAAAMPYEAKRITGSYYGIHLFSRLPLVNPDIRAFAGRDTPSVVTGVALDGGESFTFVGIHPKPPLPGQSALGRDEELHAAARMLRERPGPAILAGDLNATPWEQGVREMEHIASLRDPRHGYGYVASWNANRWWTRWPLDQILYRGGFSVVSLQRLGAFGSDHFPYVVRFCREDSTSPG